MSPTKTELAEAAKEIVARERAIQEESEQTRALVVPEGVQALAVMSGEEFERRLLQVKQGQERVARIQREYMTPDLDYGTIPGTPKPTLFKSGAEKLAQLYSLAARIESEFVAGDGEQTPPLTYDSQCYLHVGNFGGPVVAVGHGTANSWEKRYRYRRGERTCPNCGQTGTIIKGKAEYGGGWLCFAKKGGCNTKWRDGDPAIEAQVVGDVENPDPFDLSTTLQKISEKRAYVDAVLRATATSGLFTQDLAEEPEPTAEPPRPPQTEPAVRIVSDAAAPSEPPSEAPEAFMQQVIDATGGEEITVGPSNVENVERGGKTAAANEAQIAEVRRLAGELRWGAKRLLKHIADDVLDADIVIPEDANEAKDKAAATLEALSAEQIGYFLQVMRASIEEKEKEAAPQVTM